MLAAVSAWPAKPVDKLRVPAGILIVLACAPVAAQPEIHRCPQDDGTIAFQETPCAEPAAEAASVDDEADVPVAASDGFFDFVNPYDQAPEELLEQEPASEAAPLPPPVSADRAECEKLTRDAIDAIDLEMQSGYSVEEGERYKAKLMTLTRQLRACKQIE